MAQLKYIIEQFKPDYSNYTNKLKLLYLGNMGNIQSGKTKTKTKTYNNGDNNMNKMSFEQAVKQEAEANVEVKADANKGKKNG